jgi:hypothetical protein
VREEPQPEGAAARPGHRTDQASGGDVKRHDHDGKDCSRAFV